jgi:hypothetical protein
MGSGELRKVSSGVTFLSCWLRLPSGRTRPGGLSDVLQRVLPTCRTVWYHGMILCLEEM